MVKEHLAFNLADYSHIALNLVSFLPIVTIRLTVFIAKSTLPIFWFALPKSRFALFCILEAAPPRFWGGHPPHHAMLIMLRPPSGRLSSDASPTSGRLSGWLPSKNVRAPPSHRSPLWSRNCTLPRCLRNFALAVMHSLKHVSYLM